MLISGKLGVFSIYQKLQPATTDLISCYSFLGT